MFWMAPYIEAPSWVTEACLSVTYIPAGSESQALGGSMSNSSAALTKLYITDLPAQACRT